MSMANRNLKFLRKLRGMTQEEFSKKLGIKRSLLGAYEEHRAEPRIEVLETIADMFKLTLDELFRQDLSENKGSYLSKRRSMKLVGVRGEIPFVPIKAAAGYLAGFADPEFVDELNTFTLPMLSGGHYRAFEIVGDSMLPTPSGSVIVGEKIESLDDVKASSTYIVVSRTDGIVYKRIAKNNKQKNRYTLVSDNPAYEPYTVLADDMVEVWQAQMIISKANAQHRVDVSAMAHMVNTLQQQVSVLKKKMQ